MAIAQLSKRSALSYSVNGQSLGRKWLIGVGTREADEAFVRFRTGQSVIQCVATAARIGLSNAHYSSKITVSTYTDSAVSI
jgi:hypothetical protein